MKGEAVIKCGNQTMKMKKYTMMFAFLIAMIVSISCHAQITEADLNIGGIYLGQPMADVIKKFGQPVRRVSTPPAGSAPVFRCGNSEIVVKGRETVRSAHTLSGNDCFTTAGIGIGSTYDEVIKTYGKADSDSFITHPNVTQHYISYKIPKGNNIFWLLSFEMFKEKKVTCINIYEDDGSDY